MFRYELNDFPTLHLASNGMTVRIGTLIEAAEALLSRWPPDEDCEEYVVAVKTCLDAITGLVTAGEARLTLIRAAEEAGMRVITLAHVAENGHLASSTPSSGPHCPPDAVHSRHT
jgi:hypothetical protein